MVVKMAKKLVYGVALNDANYKVTSIVNGKRIYCRYYRSWLSMIERCYYSKYHERYPTYADCSVCDEWLTFSNFKAWMEKQDWQGKHLDKDLIITGNKVYSPYTCAFVSPVTNLFTMDTGAARGEFPIGVYYDRTMGKLVSSCCNPFTKKQEKLGTFNCKIKAHEAWKIRKHELACKLAELQTDKRVADALRVRYL